MNITLLRCQKCGHEWFPRTPEPPKVCPKCKSYEWTITLPGAGGSPLVPPAPSTLAPEPTIE